MSWANVKHKILFKYQSPRTMTQASFQNSLMAIANFAEHYHIASDDAETACWSNLTEIIVKANKAIERKNIGDLEELFHLAATKTNGELRVILRPQSQTVLAAIRRDHDVTIVCEPVGFDMLKNRLKHRYRLAIIAED